MSRKITRRLLEAIEEGFVTRNIVLQACLEYMSEDRVRDMCEQYFSELLDLPQDPNPTGLTCPSCHEAIPAGTILGCECEECRYVFEADDLK